LLCSSFLPVIDSLGLVVNVQLPLQGKPLSHLIAWLTVLFTIVPSLCLHGILLKHEHACSLTMQT